MRMCCAVVQLREELTRALLEAKEKEGSMNEQGMTSTVDSFEDLVREVMSHKANIKAFAFKTKAMVKTKATAQTLYLSAFV